MENRRSYEGGTAAVKTKKSKPQLYSHPYVWYNTSRGALVSLLPFLPAAPLPEKVFLMRRAAGITRALCQTCIEWTISPFCSKQRRKYRHLLATSLRCLLSLQRHLNSRRCLFLVLARI